MSNHRGWALAARITTALAATGARTGLGLVLVAMGIRFVSDMAGLTEVVPAPGSAGAFVLAHYIVLAHVGGGLMILAGFLTRWAAVAQIPILLGALMWVDFGHGVPAGTSPAFTWAVLAMLGVTTWLGGGRWSADAALDRAMASQTTPARSLS